MGCSAHGMRAWVIGEPVDNFMRIYGAVQQ